MDNLFCKVPEAELSLHLGSMEMDIMDSLQVVSDVAVWVWIQSLFLVLYVSGKGQERVQHPSGSSVPAEGSRWQGSHCLGSGVLECAGGTVSRASNLCSDFQTVLNPLLEFPLNSQTCSPQRCLCVVWSPELCIGNPGAQGWVGKGP